MIAAPDTRATIEDREMKTAELTGAALDWAVAQIEKPRLSQSFARKNVVVLAHGGLYAPTIDWAQGGPIIEREEISIAKLEETLPDAIAPHPACWSGHIDGVFVRYGPTPLIAAMRCYVASKLGDTVEIPEELNNLSRC
jgi:hypothetical protein